jgi:hypothetical protein
MRLLAQTRNPAAHTVFLDSGFVTTGRALRGPVGDAPE